MICMYYYYYFFYRRSSDGLGLTGGAGRGSRWFGVCVFVSRGNLFGYIINDEVF